jgi:hypothetical protein
MENQCSDCPGKNAWVSGFTETGGAPIITADFWVAHYVAVAHESSDATLWPSPSSSRALVDVVSTTSSLTLIDTASIASSSIATSASSSSATVETENNQSDLTIGAKAGIAAAVAIIVAAVVAIVFLLYRRRERKQEISQLKVDNVYTKAELPGESKPHVELDEAAGYQEADGSGRPLEADNSNVRAELESDWTGWEAPALLEVELSREAPDLLREEVGQEDEQRNSIQQTPVDMIARR